MPSGPLCEFSGFHQVCGRLFPKKRAFPERGRTKQVNVVDDRDIRSLQGQSDGGLFGPAQWRLSNSLKLTSVPSPTLRLRDILTGAEWGLAMIESFGRGGKGRGGV